MLNLHRLLQICNLQVSYMTNGGVCFKVYLRTFSAPCVCASPLSCTAEHRLNLHIRY